VAYSIIYICLYTGDPVEADSSDQLLCFEDREKEKYVHSCCKITKKCCPQLTVEIDRGGRRHEEEILGGGGEQYVRSRCGFIFVGDRNRKLGHSKNATTDQMVDRTGLIG
jgi:hypothetical protein